MALVEGLVGQALGLLAAAAAMMLFLHQAHLVTITLQRQLRDDDQQALSHMLRAELRIAGQRHHAGPSAEHDVLRVEGRADSPALHYLCDACGATSRTRSAGFRLQSSALAYRHPGSTAHQSLHDARLSALQAWRIEALPDPDCLGTIRIRLEPQDLRTAAWQVQVRPRNLALRPCEQPTATDPVQRYGYTTWARLPAP